MIHKESPTFSVHGNDKPPNKAAAKVEKPTGTLCLYVILARNGLTKIGKSNNPQKRFREIDNLSPVELRLVIYFSYDAKAVDLEKILHRTFTDKRVKGEWFALSFYDFEIFFSLTKRYLTGENRRLAQAQVEHLYRYNLPANF